MAASPQPSNGDTALYLGLLVLLVWLPLPWGSNVVWAKHLFVVASATLLGLWLLGCGLGVIRAPRRLSLLAPLLWWMLWLLWLTVSVVEWDARWIARWAPESFRLQTLAAEQGVVLRSVISIMPTATVDALLLSGGYGCLYFLTALTCHAQPERARKLLAVIVVSGLAQALYGSLMVLSGLEWGFLEAKRHYLGVTTGTFVNRNHLAGYMELCGAAALGLILSDLSTSSGPRSWRQWALDTIALIFSRKVRIRLALVIMAIALVMSRSRMGNTAFLAALVICGFGYILLRHRERVVGAFLLFASVVIIDLLIVTRWYGLDQLVERIEDTRLEEDGRARVLTALPAVVETYWRSGSGLGSFAEAYSPFHTGEFNERFVHAHNDYLQFLIETGAPGFALLAIFVLAHALHAVRVLVNRRSRLPAAVAFACLMAITALGLHSLTDFNLQIPANAATLIVLMALSATIAPRSSQRKRDAGKPAGEDLHLKVTDAGEPQCRAARSHD